MNFFFKEVAFTFLLQHCCIRDDQSDNNSHFLFCIGNGLGKNHRKTRRIQKMWEYIQAFGESSAKLFPYSHVGSCDSNWIQIKYIYVPIHSCKIWPKVIIIIFFLSTMSVLLGQNWLKLQTQTQVYIPICMPDFNVSIFYHCLISM